MALISRSSRPVGRARRHPAAPYTPLAVHYTYLKLRLHADEPHSTLDGCISLWRLLLEIIFQYDRCSAPSMWIGLRVLRPLQRNYPTIVHIHLHLFWIEIKIEYQIYNQNSRYAFFWQHNLIRHFEHGFMLVNLCFVTMNEKRKTAQYWLTFGLFEVVLKSFPIIHGFRPRAPFHFPINHWVQPVVMLWFLLAFARFQLEAAKLYQKQQQQQ